MPHIHPYIGAHALTGCSDCILFALYTIVDRYYITSYLPWFFRILKPFLLTCASLECCFLSLVVLGVRFCLGSPCLLNVEDVCVKVLQI